MDHLREDQPVYAHAAKDLAPAAHLHVGNVGAGSYSGTGTDDFPELSPFIELPLPDFPPYG
ncbi:hypothetical protein SLEP1_g12746 [Rubroshorea leprosula]|uniref:Uncharacterized protein n=1 Tax=Rubroshorea leprosula TaxID=152421 RepID=A0AAV5IDH3_9ROSI|nr:hypothetical protein SLEP1_g12746 [Rubroshorea leprosula]